MRERESEKREREKRERKKERKREREMRETRCTLVQSGWRQIETDGETQKHNTEDTPTYMR
jgi:hypothetical protein